MAGVLNNPDGVAAVYYVGGIIFLLGLFAGTGRTMARVVYYRWKGIARPRLLTRDAIVYGGFSTSMALITVIRFLPLEQRLAFATGNVLWALATTLPACIAVVAYTYFEFFVVERLP